LFQKRAEVELIEEWQTFEEQFVVTDDANNARLHFDVGDAEISVELASVSLCRLPDGRCIESHLPTAQHGKWQQSKIFLRDGEALKPLISVTIPCYNQAQYLGEAIESVIAQRYPRFEIIVVDDGSPDNTVDVARAYAGIRYMRLDNQGVSAARNAGVRESKGHYLVVLDAHDRLLPNALHAGLSCLDDHPECAFASGHIRLISSDGSRLPFPEQSCIEREHYLALLQGCYIWTPAAVIFRHSVFESGFAFEPSLSGSEDWDLYLRISRSFSVCCHNNVVAEHRVHAMSITANVGTMLKECMTALHRQWGYVKGNKAYEQAYRIGTKFKNTMEGRWLVRPRIPCGHMSGGRLFGIYGCFLDVIHKHS
jgi:glycosyltransferase involved in cell wall biosynthesis